MTTVAYRGGILATDSRTTISGSIQPERAKKAIACAWGVAGAAGTYAGIRAFLDWARVHVEGPKRPPHPPKFPGEITGMLIFKARPNVVFYLENNYCWDDRLSSSTPFAAIGSGGEYALAAMYAGKSAAQAVKIAAMIDSKTGGQVRQYRL